jgi:hypothetical protein
VRYVDGLLPATVQKRVLFADGSDKTEHVLYAKPLKLSTHEQTVRFLMGWGNDEQIYRTPKLRMIDGPTTKAAVHTEMARLTDLGRPALLYFTGHGDRARNLNNNVFALWEGDTKDKSATGLSVQELSADIAKLRPGQPVTLVMVQCFSGAFGNVLFEDGDPEKPLVDRPVCGFFATTRERTAAGCTPEINEENYHDFTSYFFAALSGRDRLGKPSGKADYDKNGVVGMDEAFAYALINEPSNDVPVATSDIFLRRYVSVSDDEITQVPFARVREMASSAQRAVLDALSGSVEGAKANPLPAALADVRARMGNGQSHHSPTVAQREARETVQTLRRDLLRRFPKLQNKTEWEGAYKEAVAYLQANPTSAQKAQEAMRLYKSREAEQYADELTGARRLRLLRTAKSVVLENRLRQTQNTELIARFDRLKALEAANPIR